LVENLQEKIDLQNKYDFFTKYASAEASKENNANEGPLPFGGLIFPDYKPSKAEIELFNKKKKVVNMNSKKDEPKKIDKTVRQEDQGVLSSNLANPLNVLG
jgi:hypothetical protein